tara:strand:- start:93 stop:419 length:327 start_codon:yes stop_codon:yes gene_type:complete
MACADISQRHKTLSSAQTMCDAPHTLTFKIIGPEIPYRIPLRDCSQNILAAKSIFPAKPVTLFLTCLFVFTMCETCFQQFHSLLACIMPTPYEGVNAQKVCSTLIAVP